MLIKYIVLRLVIYIINTEKRPDPDSLSDFMSPDIDK